MTRSQFRPLRLAIAISLLFGHGSWAATTPISLSDVPLDVSLNQANSVMLMDDSGSMDFELILSANNDGVLYWNTTSKSYAITSSSGSKKSPHLFPLGWDTIDSNSFFVGDMNLENHWAIPYTEDYAYLRSSDFNPLYYNPRLTYKPWPNAVIGGAAKTFADQPVTAARSHPYFTAGKNDDSGTATTVDLTKTYYGTATSRPSSCNTLSSTATTRNDKWMFTVWAGMNIPSTIKPSGTEATGQALCYRVSGTTTSWTAVASAPTSDISGGKAQKDLEVMIPYNPASFWMKDSSCTSGWPLCAADPSGNKYKRFDINSLSGSSYTLPDGTVINRTKAQELQNFANWFSYARKRKLMMASSMGNVIDGLQDNYRKFSAAAVFMNNLPTLSNTNPKIYDFTNTSTANNGRTLAGLMYSLKLHGGTPTWAGLNRAGETFGYSGPFNQYLIDQSSTDGITNSSTAEAALRCSANSTFIITDGYATDVSSSNTLYNVAKTYYDNLRWWNPNSGNIGKTMSTYGITLGALGTVYQGNADAADPTSWPTPASGSATAIDDLWRATKYSKGKLLSATNPTVLDASINSIISSMFASGTGSGLAFSSPQIPLTGGIGVQASYDSGDWTGDLKGYSVIGSGTNEASLDYTSLKWSAKELLNSRTSANRIIATFDSNNKVGIPFTSSALDTAGLITTFNSGATSDATDVIAWLRGDRSKEGDLYRKRSHLLGDIVNSTPIYVNEAYASYSDPGYSSYSERMKTRTDVVYVGANDGMLHAFDTATGVEKWAYIPGLVHGKLNSLAQPAYKHQFTVDGTLKAWDVQFDTSSSEWNTVLIGGLRGGGKGYFALDITNPDVSNETDLAKKVLWEFTDTNMGNSYGQPHIVKTKNYGWVALLPSGYNTADGKGHLYVVNIKTGALIKDLVVNVTSGAAYDQVGLAEVTPVVDYDIGSVATTAYVRYVYGGDLNGNLWRFNLRDENSSNWSVKLLATNLNTTGGSTAGKAPITAAPAVGFISSPGPVPSYQNALDVKTSRLMVFVGNGKLLHANDFNTDDKNGGFYAIEDADDDLVIGTGACANLACLVKNGLGQTSSSLGLNNWSTIANSSLTSWWAVDKGSFTWNGKQRALRGWYFAFSETGGERLITKPRFVQGAIVFTTTMKTDSRHTAAGTCEQAYSAIYVAAADKGGILPNMTSIRDNLGFGIASGLSILMTADGKFWGTGGIRNGTTDAGQYKKEVVPPPAPSNSKLRRYGWREIYR